MKKIISCKPVDDIELQFNGGESILLRFDVESLMHLQEIEGNLNELFKMPIPEMCALVIYAGAVAHNEGMTKEKAREMVCGMSIDTINAILEEFGASMGQNNSEYGKKLMAQFLAKKR